MIKSYQFTDFLKIQWNLPPEIKWRDDCCSICLSRDALDLVSFGCTHTYHRGCIDRWRGGCPLCRQPLDISVTECIYKRKFMDFFHSVGLTLVRWIDAEFPILRHTLTGVLVAFPYIEIENPEFIVETFVTRKPREIKRKSDIFLGLLHRSRSLDDLRSLEFWKRNYRGDALTFVRVNEGTFSVDVDFLLECVS